MRAVAIAAILALLIPAAGSAFAQTNVTIDPASMTAGFMNVFNLPPTHPTNPGDGAFQFNGGWGFNDLVASFAGNVLTWSVNTIGDPDPYWYVGGGGPGAQGNKCMEANGYAESVGTLNGQDVIFSFTVTDYTLASSHQFRAFIRDFAPDFSSFNDTTIPVTGTGFYQLSLTTVNDPARPVQYGFQMKGENVWITDAGNFGQVVITPESVVSNEDSSFGAVKALY